MDREQILATIDAAYAARVRGDVETTNIVWAADATLEIAGDKSLLAAFPAGPMGGEPAVAALTELVEMQEAERVVAVVEGHRAAVLWRATIRIGQGEPRETMLYDLWEFDAQGKARSLVQFADTALVAAEMRAQANR